MPPASASAGLPAPLAPWHAWHFCSYTAAPARAVPLPFGSPAPFGGMLMSQRAISAAETVSPSAGPFAGGVARWAAHAATSTSAAAAATRLCIDMAHAPLGVHRPGDDRIVVEAVGRRIAREPFLARRLHASVLVGRPALQRRRLPFPFPRQAKAHQGLRPLRAVERGLAPARAAIGRHFDAAQAPGAAPGDARDFV